MTRSKSHPYPDPDRVEWDKFKGGCVRLYAELCGDRSLHGRLIWVSYYTIGLEVDGGARIIVNKAHIARTELLKPAQQVCGCVPERDTANGVAVP